MTALTLMTISIPGVASVANTGDPAITAQVTPDGDGIVVLIDGTMAETATVNFVLNNEQVGSIQIPNLASLMTEI